jgi:hypothetical protein
MGARRRCDCDGELTGRRGRAATLGRQRRGRAATLGRQRWGTRGAGQATATANSRGKAGRCRWQGRESALGEGQGGDDNGGDGQVTMATLYRFWLGH